MASTASRWSIGTYGLIFVLVIVVTTTKVPSNRKSSMDSSPTIAIEFLKNNTFDDQLLSSYRDLYSLPSRYAVERVPTVEERAEEHFPIRDAVEKRPPIEEYLENFKSHTLKTGGEDNPYRVVCFVSNWAFYRKTNVKYTPDYVDPKLCTHIVYAYASLNAENYSIAISDTVTDIDNAFYKKITSPEITSTTRVLISVGGWTDSAGEKYSKLVSSGNNRKKFVNSVIAFLRRHEFHGLHFDWDYPVCWQARCSEAHSSDRANFVKLIQELRREFDKQTPRYELAIGVSGYKEIIDVGYDVLNLSENVDFMSIMTYDYHGAWENRTGHISPLYSEPNDPFPEYSTDATMSTLTLLGADPKKLVVGLPLYGQSFTLANKTRHDIGDTTLEPGEPGEYTRQPGILSYSEICVRIKKRNWRIERNSETGTDTYAYYGNQWVGFDDRHSLRKKVNYVKKAGYGGVMVWTLDLDDYNNECCTGTYPLLREVNVALGRIQSSSVKSDCTKPVIIPLANGTDLAVTTTITTEIDEETTSYSSSYSTGLWSTTTTTSLPNTSKGSTVWWPPTLTTRRMSSRRPRPSTQSTTFPILSTTISSSKRPTYFTNKPTKVTRWTTTKSTTSSIEEIENIPEETTPNNDGQCVNGKYYSDPASCTSYYICVYGKKKKHYCAIGLHWNWKMQICDWPSKASCWEHLVSENHRLAQSNVRHEFKMNQIPIIACKNGEHYSVSGDCTVFYACINGHLTKQKCPNNLTWNHESKLCDWRHNKGCNDTRLHIVESFREISLSSTRTKTKLDKIKADKGCSRGQFTAHPTNCNKYYQCLWDAYKEISCAPGLFWNKEMSICDWPNNVDCVNNIDTSNDEPEESESPFIPQKPTTSQTTQTPWWMWSETPSSPTTSKSPWWTWSETPWTSSESPSTSWEWTPSTTPAATLPTTKPPYSLTGKYKVVCYFTNWAWYRPGFGKYIPEDTDTNLCTHIVYGFTVLDYERLTIRIHDSWADVDNRFFERVAALKKRGVKVTVAIGGWNDSAGDKYSRLVNNPSARTNFISSVLRFINKYGFDGLDLDWEYPKCWQTNCNKGPESDKEAFSALVTELRESFDKHGYLLSAAVSPSKVIIDSGYDVPLLSQKLDWIAVMTYDFHGQWDKKTGHVAPIHYIPGDDYDYFNTYYAINYWIEKGANSRKIVMGMPMYGQGFTLTNASDHGLNAPASGPSRAGEYTRSAGFLAYYEICQKIQKEHWTIVQDPQGRRGPYAYKGSQWVGFDDIHSITIKINLIKKLQLGGGMIWALDLDDFRNVCGDGHYPLLTTIARGLAHVSPDVGYEPENEITWSTPKIPSISTPNYNFTSTKRTTTYQPATKPLKKPTTSRSTTTTTTTTTLNPFTEEGYEGDKFSNSFTTNTPSSPPGVTSEEKFKVVCYFTNWAWYRPGSGKYLVNDIDTQLCTHMIYAFAVLDSNKLIVKPHDSWADIDNKFYEKFVSLKKQNVKVLLAIGGWNDSAGNKYSRLVNNKQSRSKFITHVIQFLKKYDFDGLDVDWEYPKCWQVNCKLGPSSDKKDFSDFISELRKAFDAHGLLLSAAVSPNKKVIDEGYDVSLLSEKLDWISVMVYDFHGQWDKITGHVAPMYEHPDDFDTTFNANFSIHYWVQKGADPRKIIMGMPLYGQSFTLASSKNNGLNSVAYGGGEAGESTRARGFLSYYEICERILRRGWEIEYDINGRMGPYAKRGTQWVSFDDQAMIKHKSEYVFYNNLGGAMIWALDLDDFRGNCDCGTYPLLKTINKILRNYRDDVPECNFESNSRIDTKLVLPNEDLAMQFNNEWKFEDCSHGQIKKHPTDCSKYLTCSFGVYLQEQSCPSGLHFNERKSMCDWPKKVDCKPSIMEYAEAYYLNGPQKHSSLIIPKKSDSPYKMICYLTNWSAYRYNNLLFPIQALDMHLCTHIVYGFVGLDRQTLTIKSNETFAILDNEFFKRVVALKETGVKVLLAMGGYNRQLNGKSTRAQFIKHAVKFLEEHDFDGLELNLAYPSDWQTIPEKDAFVTLVRELREAFWKHDLLFSIAALTDRDFVEQSYDLSAISPFVDWFSLISFDYHGYWEGKTDYIAPLITSSKNDSYQSDIDSTVSYWLDAGVPSNKLILGLPSYGLSFTLRNANNNKIGSKVVGPGVAGRHTKIPGIVAFYEICEMLKEKNWKTYRDKNGHYTYSHDQWISYNDATDVEARGKYIKENDLGGASLWTLDFDDFTNMCGCGAYPLLTAINNELFSSHSNPNKTFDCAL